MGPFKLLIDIITLGSDRPVRRLVAYYVLLAVAVFLLFHYVPTASNVIKGDHVSTLTSNSQLLQDGLSGAKERAAEAGASAQQSGLELALTALVVMLSTLALMLPVSWVFMSARRARDFNQGVVQTLIVLPIVVAGIVLIVRTSLALAFSLGGIVAGLRFRTTLRDVRDTVYIFLGIGVGLAAGVQSLIVAAVLSVTFNFVVILIWRYDFGRNVLEPTAASQWAEPLSDLASNGKGVAEGVPDRDLLLALSPKRVEALAERFNRVGKMLGSTSKKPRFNAVLAVTTESPGEAQARVEKVLDRLARRWRLDEVVTTHAKPAEIYYLVGIRKSVTQERFITAVREEAGNAIITAELEIGETLAREQAKVQAAVK